MRGFTGLPVKTFTTRIEEIQKEIAKKELDALFVFSDEYRPGNTLYLSDYYPINVVEESPQGVYIPLVGEVVLFLGSINAQTARAVSWIQDIRSIEDMGVFFKSLKEEADRPLKIGLVGEALLPVHYYRRLKSTLEGHDFTYADEIVRRMRAIKSPDEVEKMKNAAHLGDAAIKEAVARLRKGSATEIELAAVAEYAIRTGGGTIGSATIVAAGTNTRMPTWRPSEKRIEPGEAVLIDANPSLQGYCADVSVTVFHGDVEAEKRNILDLSRQILRDVIDHMRPGLPASTIYEYFLERVRLSGHEQYFTPYAKGMRAVGHGVGLDVVEWPNLSADSGFALEAGMTLGVKFDLHGFEFGGVRFEADVLVETDGCCSMNRILDEQY